MNPSSKAFLYELLRTPSPTGWEQAIQRKIRDHLKAVAHSVEPDVRGNLIPSLNPQANRKVTLAGHCDRIGFLVKNVSPEGFVYLDALGGTDSGLAAASVGIPQRNMHTQVEIVSLADLDNAVKLLVGFVQSVDERTGFRPFYFRG